MDKVNCLGTTSVPMLRLPAGRIRELLNRVLPEECQVKNAADCWYVGCIVSGVLTMMLPYCLPLLGYCLYRAKKAGKGGAK